MQAPACPDDDRLRAWLSGGLPAEAAGPVNQHWQHCQRCQERTLRWTAADDGLEARLRRADVPSADSELQAFLARARAAGPVGPPCGGRLREYQLLGKLGEGGMGAVYRALHLKLNREVALKVLPSDRLRDPSAVARFEAEMKQVARLDHPNIVRATDAGEVDGVHFLVMELVGGVDLSALVQRRGPLAVADACEVARQAALGLQHVHEQGLVHRDVKPSNLMLTHGGQVKLLDLGLARLSDPPPGAAGQTASGYIVGTPDYLAPEQIDRPSAVDIRADVYGLGCTLYHLLAGRVPFPGGSVFEKLQAHQSQQPTPLTALRSDIPAALQKEIDKMMAKLRDRRHATPAEAAAALAPFCPTNRLKEYFEEPETVPLDRTPRPSPRGGKRRPLLWAAAGLTLVSLVVLGAVWVANAPPPPETRTLVPDPGNGVGGGKPEQIRPTPKVSYDRRLEGHTGNVLCVAFSADGRQAISGGVDKFVRLWTLSAPPQADDQRPIEAGKR